MNNSITYVAPKNKTMAHTMSLNNMISCIVVISIFVFKKCWQIFFNSMELNMSPTFNHFLKSETENTEKKIILSTMWYKNNESLPQADNDETANIQNILLRSSWMDYSSVINFQTSLIKVDEAKALPRKNQVVKTNQKQWRRCRCVSIKHLLMTSNNCPVGISYRNAKIGPGNKGIFSWYKEGSRICSSKVRVKFSGGKCVWGGWRIIWEDIISKSGWCGRTFLGVSLIRTGWKGWVCYKGVTKG